MFKETGIFSLSNNGVFSPSLQSKGTTIKDAIAKWVSLASNFDVVRKIRVYMHSLLLIVVNCGYRDFYIEFFRVFRKLKRGRKQQKQQK